MNQFITENFSDSTDTDTNTPDPTPEVAVEPITFGTFVEVPGMRPCRKRPVIVHAKKMDIEFRVITLEGDYKLGKPGDYLMKGIDGENYICDGNIYERSYDFV